LGAGILAGVLLQQQGSALSLAKRLMTWSIYLMVFLLGSSAGGNTTVIANFGRLGGQAGLLCAGAVLGSVCASRLVARCFLQAARHEE
jgi:hypothetical protein